jgi:hypothetical protein
MSFTYVREEEEGEGEKLRVEESKGKMRSEREKVGNLNNTRLRWTCSTIRKNLSG